MMNDAKQTDARQTDARQTDEVLSEVTEIIRQEPHSASALILYALVNTLAYEKSGCLFKLDKLRDLDNRHRQLAYQLIEIMVRQENQGEKFATARQEMDELVRSA